MWHLRKANYISGQLFHTMGDVAAYILSQAEKLENYSLNFVPIWQPLQEKPSSENVVKEMLARPIPMSHTETL